MKLNELEAAVEAILFASGNAVEIADLARAIEQDIRTSTYIVRGLSDRFAKENRGVEIIEVNDTFQLRTRQHFYPYIKNLYQSPTRKQLSPTLIETLAIIAYRQPVTKGQIEEIRGVSADHAVNKLIDLGLVCEIGRSDMPGKPLVFGTTNEFLKYYGFSKLNDLPKLPETDEQLRLEVEQEVFKF